MPRSQVSERRSCSGIVVIWVAMASRIASAPYALLTHMFARVTGLVGDVVHTLGGTYLYSNPVPTDCALRTCGCNCSKFGCS